MGSNQKAEGARASTLKAHSGFDRVLVPTPFYTEKEKNLAVAQNVLHEELGYFGPWEGSGYSLDQSTRDRLLAHARQDSSASALMSMSAFREANGARMLVTRVLWLVVLLVVMNAAALVILWNR